MSPSARDLVVSTGLFILAPMLAATLAACHGNTLDFRDRPGTGGMGGTIGSGGASGGSGGEVPPGAGGTFPATGGVAGMAVVGTGGSPPDGSGGALGGSPATGGSSTGGAASGGRGTGGMASGGVTGFAGGGAAARGSGGLGGMPGGTGGMVGACRTNGDCSALGLHCLLTPPLPLGLCVECLGDGMGHCPTAPRLRCDTDLHRCVDCSAKVPCQAGRCNTSEFRCVLAPCPGGSCPNGNQMCHEGTCIDCEVGSDSSGICPAGLSCMASESVCIGCTSDGQCPTAPRRLCDGIRGLCVQCRTFSDCPVGRFCNQATGVCL